MSTIPFVRYCMVELDGASVLTDGKRDFFIRKKNGWLQEWI